jgi:hypothetical protein
MLAIRTLNRALLNPTDSATNYRFEITTYYWNQSMHPLSSENTNISSLTGDN